MCHRSEQCSVLTLIWKHAVPQQEVQGGFKEPDVVQCVQEKLPNGHMLHDYNVVGYKNAWVSGLYQTAAKPPVNPFPDHSGYVNSDLLLLHTETQLLSGGEWPHLFTTTKDPAF